MTIDRVCLLGLGEVGSVLAEDLLANTNVHLRVWDWQLDDVGSPAQRNFERLANGARVCRAAAASAAATDCDVTLSAVTADQALSAAQSILRSLAEQAWFVDFNSVSPATKQELSRTVENTSARFVEASIMSPIAPRRTASPILLSGPNAREFVALGNAMGFDDMQVVSDTLGVAAATKMCRSVIVKGMEALVTESLLAARHYGVDAAVVASLENLFPRPDWPEHARYLISRSLQHGARRAAEMREVAKTVNEAGLNPWMSAASAERQQWAAQFGNLLGEKDLGNLLDAMWEQMSQDKW